MERFVIIVKGWKPLTIITKRSILDVAQVLDPPLKLVVLISTANFNWPLYDHVARRFLFEKKIRLKHISKSFQ